MPHFMPDGAEAFKKSLREEYELARERLQARLEQRIDPLEQQAVVEELERLKRDLRSKLAGIRHCLFGAKP